MSSATTHTVKHPLAMQFIGHIGRTIYDEDITDQGMFANLGNVLTSIQGGGVKETPVTLISFKNTANSLAAGDICSITCKLIGSNTDKRDQLHFTAGTKIKLGEEGSAPVGCSNEMINKVAMIGLGLIIKKKIIEYDTNGLPLKVELLLKSVDFDPIVKDSPVMWLTKHHVHASLFTLGIDNQFNEGEEIQISGMVVDYDNVEHMWQTHVYELASCGIQTHRPVDVQRDPVISKHMEVCCAELFIKYRVIAKDRYKRRVNSRAPPCPKRSYSRYLLWKSAQLERFKQKYPGGRRSSVA